MDYSWSMLSELGQTGLLVTGLWGCCVSCPSCLPSFLPGFIEGVCLSGLYYPAPCPHTQPRRQVLQKFREELLAVVSQIVTASKTGTRLASLEALGA